MPLQSGRGAVGANIRELVKANAAKRKGKRRSRKQILAIALAKARERKR